MLDSICICLILLGFSWAQVEKVSADDAVDIFKSSGASSSLHLLLPPPAEKEIADGPEEVAAASEPAPPVQTEVPKAKAKGKAKGGKAKAKAKQRRERPAGPSGSGPSGSGDAPAGDAVDGAVDIADAGTSTDPGHERDTRPRVAQPITRFHL